MTLIQMRLDRNVHVAFLIKCIFFDDVHIDATFFQHNRESKSLANGSPRHILDPSYIWWPKVSKRFYTEKWSNVKIRK